ncbi:hypothetical protein GCM10020218_104090 [Dactylosporangium vinaceum]
MLGPPGWTMPVCEIDLQQGGAFRYVWRNKRRRGADDRGHVRGDRAPPEACQHRALERRLARDPQHAHLHRRRRRRPDPDHHAHPLRVGRGPAPTPCSPGCARASTPATRTWTDTWDGQFTMRLELVPVPVSDVDAALAFYADRLGFHVDHDIAPGNGARIVQLTPPGSACSILLSENLPGMDAAPGVLQGLHLVVNDVRKARAVLLKKGVEAGEIMDMGGILYVPCRRPGRQQLDAAGDPSPIHGVTNPRYSSNAGTHAIRVRPGTNATPPSPEMMPSRRPPTRNHRMTTTTNHSQTEKPQPPNGDQTTVAPTPIRYLPSAEPTIAAAPPTGRHNHRRRRCDRHDVDRHNFDGTAASTCTGTSACTSFAAARAWSHSSSVTGTLSL